MVLKNPFKEQPGSSMLNNAKDIELHPQKGCSNPSLKGSKPNKLPHHHEIAVAVLPMTVALPLPRHRRLSNCDSRFKSGGLRLWSPKSQVNQ